MLAERALLAGPPLRIALEWVSPLQHRNALVAFFSGDLFLGRYAANYYATGLLPRHGHRCSRARNSGLDPRRICLTCWIESDTLVLEDEGHICFDCPQYRTERLDFLKDLSAVTRETLSETHGSLDKLKVVMASSTPKDWTALARFLARLRQTRRRSKAKRERQDKDAAHRSWSKQKLTWQARGRFVCRH
eukprot:3970824-Karenia_brevis.AAC.1